MFVNELCYHKLRLPEEGQYVYRTVDDAIRQMRENFEIDADQPFATGAGAQRVLSGVYNDNPSFFYYTPTCFQPYFFKDKIVYEINYLYTKKQATQCGFRIFRGMEPSEHIMENSDQQKITKRICGF